MTSVLSRFLAPGGALSNSPPPATVATVATVAPSDTPAPQQVERHQARRITAPPPSFADLEAIAEAINERAAVREFDGQESRRVAETAARSAMRVYRIRVAMGLGEFPKWTTLLAPGCDLAAATDCARGQFGPDRVLEITEYQSKAPC